MKQGAPRARSVLRVLLAIVMISAGIFHFVRPAGFVKIVPSFLPAAEFLVLLSGVFEILGGAGLLHARTRRLSSFGLMALFVAVFPANINMAWNDIQPEGGHIPAALLWLRLPLQLVLVIWAWWVGKPSSDE